MPKASEEQMERLAAELQARMDEMGVTAVMLGRRSGIDIRKVRAILGGRRPRIPIGEIPLTRMAEALAVQPWMLMARLDGTSDDPLTSSAPQPHVDEGPAGRLAVLIPRLEERDQLMIERFVLRLLGQ